MGNIQESEADEPKEMFWEIARTATSNWNQRYTDTYKLRLDGAAFYIANTYTTNTECELYIVSFWQMIGIS